VGGAGRPWWERVVLGLLGLGAFVTALGLMREGASSLIPALEGSIFTDNAWSTLGVGWLGACILLSGSPVAASSLALLDGGAIDRTQSFAMLTGSRLGASFVVLVVGVVYALRRNAGRRAPLSIGVYALTITAVAYLPGAAIGWWLLSQGHLDGINLAASPDVLSVTDALFGWLPDLLDDVVPGWALFPLGIAILLGAFSCFDRVLPTVGSERFERSGRLTNPWVLFGLGCLVALLTLSVSVALTLLVPLVANGYLKREDTIPYIAGANITTLADTLVAAIIIGNPDAVRVVLAEVIGVTAFTLVLLAVAYPLVRRGAIAWAQLVLARRSHLAAFVAVLLLVPVGLIAV
jgi:solute carrier family 34 (sodium-dependent phosphate cotransporter)